MKCIECGHDMVKDTRDITYTYKGETLTIIGIKGEYCTCCDEVIFDMPEADRYTREMEVFQNKVNERLASPEFVMQTRKKLKLDQREAAKIFGGGVNAFSRYETGKNKPPEALIQLLRLLDKHPELLAEIRG